MTQPRSALVSVSDTPWYHCVSRCVRRAFLCGEDRFTGVNYEHRRGWIADRLQQLASVFAVDVAGYAVMNNHFHVVVRIDAERAENWTVDEVLARWTALYSGPLLVRRYLAEGRQGLDEGEVLAVTQWAEQYRARLQDLSWFMRTLNEGIARQANAEDGVRGRFWEGRFKSQALLDEQALIAALAYVDLNPIRAGIAETPEESDYTSIQQRLGREPERVDGPVAEAGAEDSEEGTAALPKAPLMPFDATGHLDWAIPYAFDDYLELVDWLGRAVHPAKRGRIPPGKPKILDRLGMDAEALAAESDRLLRAFGSAVGAPASLTVARSRRQRAYLRGLRAAERLFSAAA
ncbi:transposase [Thiohalorhabdus methylotrophus]|uniref:Transposase n=1 Tax=Thiohalorhabdus methylotrophus TaxID=3242694 RepID=A0ABV4TZ21_9GAMM